MSKKTIELSPGFHTPDEYLSRTVRYPLINDELTNLLGQILTIVDASITEPNQLKAIKDLIKQRFGDKIHGAFWDYCYRSDYQFSEPFVRCNVLEGTAKHSDMEYGRTASDTPPLNV